MGYLQNEEEQKYASMTKNNLAANIKWLLKQGPSLYPSLTPSAQEKQNDANVRNIARAQASSTVDHLVDSGRDPNRDGDLERILGTFVDDAEENDAKVESDDDTNMARLFFAPRSTGKCRLLSTFNTSSSETPKARNEHGPEKSPSEQRAARHPSVIEGMAAQVKAQLGSAKTDTRGGIA